MQKIIVLFVNVGLAAILAFVFWRFWELYNEGRRTTVTTTSTGWFHGRYLILERDIEIAFEPKNYSTYVLYQSVESLNRCRFGVFRFISKDAAVYMFTGRKSLKQSKLAIYAEQNGVPVRYILGETDETAASEPCDTWVKS